MFVLFVHIVIIDGDHMPFHTQDPLVQIVLIHVCTQAIVIFPQKFALLFTFGSLSAMGGLVALRGLKPTFMHMIDKERLPFR